MAHEVFISYSSKDQAIADAVCSTLEASGISCWIAPRDIVSGTEWSEAIIGAIQQCRIMIVVFSANANTSPQVKREAERAVSKGAIILPFRVEDVFPSGAMEYYLSASHWMNAVTAPMQPHLESLLHTVKLLLANAHPDGDMGDAQFGLPARAPQSTSAAGAGSSGGAVPGTAMPGGAITMPVPEALPQELHGFNWGAFLLSRSWARAHHAGTGGWLGLLSVLPYLGIIIGLIFGFQSKLALLLCCVVVVWVMHGLKGNELAWRNHRWINVAHFRKTQTNWLLRGVGFWIVVAALGTLFVKSGANRIVRALVAREMKNPRLQTLKKQVPRPHLPHLPHLPARR